jgi:hypothetical protein
MINFSVHQVRAGPAGASQDFGQMLALLVQATSGEANLVARSGNGITQETLEGLRGRHHLPAPLRLI